MCYILKTSCGNDTIQVKAPTKFVDRGKHAVGQYTKKKYKNTNPNPTFLNYIFNAGEQSMVIYTASLWNLYVSD